MIQAKFWRPPLRQLAMVDLETISRIPETQQKAATGVSAR
jgi:hypothetical protein